MTAKLGCSRQRALDPRGMGDSDRPPSGYDMRTVVADLHGFVEALGLTENGPIDVVGHDIGVWIGYAYAAEWPDDVKRLAVFDAALPGITPLPPAATPSVEVNVKTSHFAFNRLDDLPKILLQGREREFLTWLFRAKSTRPLDDHAGRSRRICARQRRPWGDAGSAFLLPAHPGARRARAQSGARRAEAPHSSAGLRREERCRCNAARHNAPRCDRRAWRRVRKLWALHAGRSATRSRRADHQVRGRLSG
jgi:pimeloyl-ACP methyl ester carboxylesterase